MSTGAAMQQRFNVRKVAVLGAGVMGAQIAAHLVNVKVPVVIRMNATEEMAGLATGALLLVALAASSLTVRKGK